MYVNEFVACVHVWDRQVREHINIKYAIVWEWTCQCVDVCE